MLGYKEQEKEFYKISFVEQASFSACRVFMTFITVGKRLSLLGVKFH